LSEGAIDLIITALDTFGTSDPKVNNGIGPELIQVAWDALSQIALHPDSVPVFLEKRLLDRALNILRTFEKSKEKAEKTQLLDAAMNVLWNTFCSTKDFLPVCASLGPSSDAPIHSIRMQ
jgi:hypothetical protein